MKFRLTFKTPDVLDQIKDFPQECHILLDKFLTWYEIIIVEFDTDTGEATVVPQT